MILGGLGLNALGQGWRSQPEMEAGSQQGKHQIPVTRPAVNDKGPVPLALQKRTSTKTESGEASEVFLRRNKYSTYG